MPQRSQPRSAISLVVSAALLAAGIGMAVAPPAAAAEPEPQLSVNKQLTQQIDDPTADNAILIGESAEYTLTVSNSPGVGRAYNVSAVDVLPVGVSYRAGSASLGEPKVIKDAPSVGKTTLIWTNLFDISPAGEAVLRYSVTPDPDAVPVGSTFSNSAKVYGTNDPFAVTTFGSTGTCLTSCAYTATDTQQTLVNAIEIRKNEPSPEGELMRGIHGANSTVYTITVTNNKVKATNGIALTDYIPAGMEFLGCGAVDNTSGTLVEYVGASRLTAVPAIASPPCRQPATVDTISDDPDGPSGPAPDAIYTEVTWPSFSLAPGATRTFTYRAGIPLYANELTWPGAAPSAASGTQAANLDNNTGASTAEAIPEVTYTNYALASGSYQGPGVGNPTGPVAVQTENTSVVTSEDLATRKTVSPSTFTIGGTATFTITTRTSEYRSSTGVSIVDTLPDGLSYVPGSAVATLDGSSIPLDVAVDASAPAAVKLTFTAGDGALPTEAVLVITFRATMNGEYASGAPTAAGDEYVNRIATAGTTALDVTPSSPPGPGTSEGPIGVADTSTATITSTLPAQDKRVGQNRSTSDCAAQAYGDAKPTPPFQIGDTVCFELNVDFVPGVSLNNVLSPVVRDFLPSTLRYVPGSAVVGPANTIPADQIRFSDAAALGAPGGSLLWTLGELDPQATNPDGLVVRPTQGGADAYFQVRFAAVVVTTVLDNAKEITGNLLKTSALDSAGQAITGRDQVDFELAGSQVAISKGVAQINGAPTPPFPPNTDNKNVKGGDVVTFRVDVTNVGTAGAGSNVPVRRISVVDDLPTGITCTASITAISDGGTCSDGSPSRISWTSVPGEIGARETKTLTYKMAIPADVNVNTNYVNRATVTEYESLTNNTWVPNAPVGITDTSNVRTSNAAVTKAGETSRNVQNNDRLKQFTVGESITYRVTGTIPAGTTARNGVITDDLPANLRYDSATAVSNLVADNGRTATPGGAALPSGAVLAVSGRKVTLTLASVLTNSTNAAMTYTVTIVATVLGGTYSHGLVISNTGRFSGGVPGNTFNVSRSYDATVVIPNPVIAKSNRATEPVRLGVPVTFDLTVTNPSGALPRPISYDTVVVDCLPAGVEPTSPSPYISPPTGDAVVPGDGTNGCPTGTTRLGWTVGAVETGSSVTLTYSAAIASDEVAGTSYTNEATVTGGSLDEGLNSDVEGVYSSSATSSISSSNGELSKSVSPPQAAVGETATWTIKATYDDLARFYAATVIDVIPAGLDLTSLTALPVTCSEPGAPICGTTPTPAVDPSTRTVTWTVGDVGRTAADLVVTIRYSARVDSGQGSTAGTVLTNTATSTWRASAAPDSALITGKSATADLVVTQPQLSITKDVETTTPTPGAPYTYTITVTNATGDLVSAAYAIEVQDAVPDGVIVDGSAISDGGSLTGASPTGGGTVSWLLPGPLAPGASTSLTYVAALPSSATTGAYTNTVDVASYASFSSNADTYDDVPPAQATVTVGDPSADLSIVKTPSGSTTPGSIWTFTMSVTNEGPSDAEGPITVIDELPAGLTYLSVGNDWDCFPFGQTVFCVYFDGLAAKETAPDLMVTVQIASSPANASYRNVATVESLTVDPDPSNNESSATVTVSPTPQPPTPVDPDQPVDPTDPGKPTGPTDPVDPGKPTDPTGPGKPTDPGRPTVVPQRPVTPLPIPERLQPSRPSVVLPAGVVTNAGQPVRATVQCRPLMRWTDKVALTLSGGWVPMGDLRYCSVRTTKKGKVIVTPTFPGPVLVKVTYTAKKVPGYSAYTKVKRWLVIPR